MRCRSSRAAFVFCVLCSCSKYCSRACVTAVRNNHGNNEIEIAMRCYNRQQCSSCSAAPSVLELHDAPSHCAWTKTHVLILALQSALYWPEQIIASALVCRCCCAAAGGAATRYFASFGNKQHSQYIAACLPPAISTTRNQLGFILLYNRYCPLGLFFFRRQKKSKYTL